MTVGNAASSAQIDQALRDLTVALRSVCTQITWLNQQINGNGNGLTVLESLPGGGYSSAANPDNPGGISDAQLALNDLGYLNNVAGVWKGTATVAGDFNFENQLAHLIVGILG